MKTARWSALAAALLAAGCGGGGGGGGGGTLYFSQDDNPNGLYRLDTSTGTATLVGLGITTVDASTCGLTETDDPDVLIGSQPFDLLEIDADGSGATVLSNLVYEGLAFHAPNGLLYAVLNTDFDAVDPATGAIVDNGLAAAPVDVEGLASDSDGTIYALGNSSNLYAYDVSADSWSVVGDTGIPFGIGAGLAYDPGDDVLYAVCGDGGGDNLYRIDPQTASTTLVGPTGLTPTSGGLAFVRD